jgi:DNA-binding transcriptional ArsR family regulator
MLLSDPMLDDVSHLFRALGEAPRLRILRVLLKEGRPMSQKDLARAAGLSQANSSKHLLLLASVGLVHRVPQGNLALFSPATPMVEDLCEKVCDFVAQRIRTSFESLS